jgi:hypothetical protein
MKPCSVVGEVMYNRLVYILMAWQKQSDDLAASGRCISSLDRGFRLALTTTHQNNSDSTAWPELAARTVCCEANPSPRALFSVYYLCTSLQHPRALALHDSTHAQVSRDCHYSGDRSNVIVEACVHMTSQGPFIDLAKRIDLAAARHVPSVVPNSLASLYPL